jgi:branched-chain amino acid transport system permease protein
MTQMKINPFRLRFLASAAVLTCLAAVPFLAAWLDDPFMLRVATRMVIFAIAASALNLVLGYGKLVSLVHAGIFCAAAYVVAILAYHDANGEALAAWTDWTGTSDFAVSLPLALLTAGALSLVIGAVSLRTSGSYFIMITLAFNQMIYFGLSAAESYGGDDGLQVFSDITGFGVDLTDRTTLYVVCLGALLLVVAGTARLVVSRFGMVLRAAAQNERRTRAVGFDVYLYRLVAFALSGLVAGLAGALWTVSQGFVSPADGFWLRSADLVIMVVLGGVATVTGPVIGAVAVVLLELVLSDVTLHWHLWFGLFLIAAVLLRGRDGAPIRLPSILRRGVRHG